MGVYTVHTPSELKKNLPKILLKRDLFIDSPICSTERTTYGVSTLEPVEIKCKVDSVPPAHTFYWSLNSSAHHKPMPLHGFHNQIKGQMSIVSDLIFLNAS